MRSTRVLSITVTLDLLAGCSLLGGESGGPQASTTVRVSVMPTQSEDEQ